MLPPTLSATQSYLKSTSAERWGRLGDISVFSERACCPSPQAGHQSADGWRAVYVCVHDGVSIRYAVPRAELPDRPE